MAMTISKTPTLRAKEADKFQRQADANRSKCASKKQVVNAVKAYISVVKQKAHTSK